MEKVSLTAKKRKALKKSATKKVRNAGNVPGNFYRKSEGAFPIEVVETDINPLVFSSETHIIDLKIEGEKEYECVIKDVQFDPLTSKLIHFDLLGLVRGQRIQLDIPVVLKGTPVGVKEGGQLQHMYHKIHVECLPKDIPEYIELDVSELEVNDYITFGDLDYPELTFLNQDRTVLVAVTPPKGFAELPEEGEEGELAEGELEGEEMAEPEVIAKGKDKNAEEEEQEEK